MTMQSDIGLIGLAVMGENLALNMESKGFSVAVFNRTTAVTEKFAATRGKGKKITPTSTIEEFIGTLKRPRKAMMMIKAGKPVDQVISEVVPLLEYGDMQLICEAYAILKNVLGLEAKDLADIFAQWNRGALESYLIEITAEIFRKRDPDTGKALVDVILDKAGQKGTGLWTLQSALSQSVVISTINAAVEARVISSRKEERVAASKILPQPQVPTFSGNRDELVQAVHDALYASKIVSYAQGMELLGAASTAYNWNLNFGDIATIWRGGCIIRAKFLDRITEAYARDPKLHNLLLDQYFTDIIAKTQRNWRIAVSTAINYGVAVPAFSASLAYFDSYRSARLPSNLLQAQRDFFGAHTYERIDKPGIFHTDWMGDQPAQEIRAPKPTAKRHAGE